MNHHEATHVQVCVRFRPRNGREIEEEKVGSSSIEWNLSFTGSESFTTKTIHEKHEWSFDHVFQPESLQDDIYVTTAKRCIEYVFFFFFLKKKKNNKNFL